MAYRYVIFSARFDPYIGGVESFTLNLARELVNRGDSVTVVTKRIDDSPEKELRNDGISVVRLPTLSLVHDRLPLSRRNKRHFALLNAIADQEVDRVLVNNRFYPHSIDGLQFAQRVHAPAVVLDHGSAYLTLGSPLVDWAIKVYERSITRKVKRFNPTFCGVSAKSAEWLNEFEINTTSVVPNAIDAESFRAQASSRDFKAELRINSEEVLVAFVGRLTPEKGGDALLRAAATLTDKPIRIAFAGEGTMRRELESAAGNNAHFLGLLNRADLSALLRDADAFCLPSRSEGFCTSLLEASAWATPAIITDVGGAREIIRDPSCGMIIDNDSGEAVAESLNAMFDLGPDGRKIMGENARAITEHYCSWTASANALDNVFRQTMEATTQSQIGISQ